MSVKQFYNISKMSHVRLNFKEIHNNLPLIKQNIKNRKADSYANADLVGQLYQQYRIQRHELDGAKHKRKEHNTLIK